MSKSDLPIDFNVDELLAGRALGNLSEQESDQLASILAKDPGQDTDDFDYVVAALTAGSVVPQEMPSTLRDSVHREAPSYLPTPTPGSSTGRNFTGREFLAWAITLACLVLVAFQFWPRESPSPPSIVARRAEMLASAPDVLEVKWGPGLHPFDEEVTGDVVWSNSLQRGYLRFTNMPVNDPGVEQYQLWIIDPQRDDEPIDGGVFDISKSGEVIVPIDAKLDVISPQAFAVTIEKPGGVVVSTQERLPLLAKVDV